MILLFVTTNPRDIHSALHQPQSPIPPGQNSDHSQADFEEWISTQTALAHHHASQFNNNSMVISDLCAMDAIRIINTITLNGWFQQIRTIGITSRFLKIFHIPGTGINDSYHDARLDEVAYVPI